MIFNNKTVRKTVIIGLFLILIIGFVGYVSALTGSIGNARMVIHGNVGDSVNKYILVKNVNNESVNIKIEKEGDLADYLTLKEDNFTLGPGEDKKAEFTIKIAKEGTTETKLNVKFAPVDGKNGVGLSSTIVVVAGEDDGSVDSGNNGTGDDTGTTDTDSTSLIDSITQKLFGKDSQIGSNIISFKGIAISITILLVIIFIVLYLISKKRAKKKKGFNENENEKKIKPKKESVKK